MTDSVTKKGCPKIHIDTSFLLETEQMTYGEYYKTETSMQKNLIALDRQVQAKRRMLSDIEKENIMTIASSLRSVPKTEAKKSNPLKEALGG